MSTTLQEGRTLPWAQVDVFTERAFEGNMLAIFPEANSLSTAQMQALARETNLSETTFILPSAPEDEAEHGIRVRIFTVEEELPFAGHPTLGTASWLWFHHPVLRGAAEIRLRLDAGTIPVRFRTPAPGEAGVYAEMRQNDPQFLLEPEQGALAAACGLSDTDLHPSLKPQVVTTGLPFCIVPLASLDALARLHVDQPRLLSALANSPAKFLYAIAQTCPGEWRARMPFYGGDDPATGSAAGCAISYLVRHGAVHPEENTVLTQGIEVHRPSRLFVRASLRSGQVTDVFVGGRTIPVASGRFTHP